VGEVKQSTLPARSSNDAEAAAMLIIVVFLAVLSLASGLLAPLRVLHPVAQRCWPRGSLALYGKKKKSNAGRSVENGEDYGDEAEGVFGLADSPEVGGDDEGEEGEEGSAPPEEGQGGEDDDGVVGSIDDILSEEDDDQASPSAIAAAKSAAWQSEVKGIILASLDAQGLSLYKLTFLPARIEVVVAGRSEEQHELDQAAVGDDEDEDYIVPSVEAISGAHRDLYARFEAREADLDVVARFELALASPGIGSVLRSRRDFETFRGFPVTVTVKEEFKKKRQFEGTLLERDDEHVLLSLKGRVVKIPRALVEVVSLPKPKYESTDTEMRKLR